MDLVPTLSIIAACLLAEAFFSGSEIGVVSADKVLLRHKAANGSKGAKLALKMLEKPEWLLSTTLVGTNISVVTNTTMATALVIHLFGEAHSWIAVVVVAPLIWVFGEIVPKSVFQQNANTITPVVIFPLRAASIVFSPILVVFTMLTRVLARLIGDSSERNPFTLREEITTMMEMTAAEGDILPQEKHMISRVFNFAETDAQAVMVPLIDVVGIERGTTCGAATRFAVERAHKRLPVYDQRVDTIVGVVNTLDMLDADADQPVTDYIQETIYIPGSKSIQQLLIEMRSERLTMAVVVDEFGGADGIVTIEDIIEEVVGELEDEFDGSAAPALFRKRGERDYVFGGRIELQSVCQVTGIKLPEGEYETIAGFLLELANDIPVNGTVVRYGDYEFTVERATDRSIEEVSIRW